MSSLDLVATTQLDAVNVLLDAAGKSPINTLEGGLPLEVVRACARLHEVSRSVQKKGWSFNTRPAAVLSPDAEGFINLGGDILSLRPSGASRSRNVIQRGERLFDRDVDSFVFTGPLTCEVITFLPFEELPEAARYYITIRAARTFQRRTLGSDSRDRITAEDEHMAFAEFVQEDIDSGKYNMLTGSFSTASAISRS